MDEAGFRAWLSRQDLARNTQGSVVSRCRRVEKLLGINLDELGSETDIEHVIKPRLWEHISDNIRVMRNLTHSMKKYLRFREDKAKVSPAKAEF